MQQLDITLWHVRLYFWCLAVWDAFRDSGSNYEETNLCHYIRTIFVSAPLALACQLGILAYAIYALIWYPVTRFGWAWYGRGLLSIGILATVIWTYRFVKSWRKERQWRASLSRATPLRRVLDVEERVLDVEELEYKPGLLKLIFKWLVAQKRKVCPLISFVRPDRKLKKVA